MNYHIFWGGADVDPYFYNEPRTKWCGTPNVERDLAELELAQKLSEQGIPMVGICRGAQMLNVFNGGRLLQHIENHIFNHKIITSENKNIWVNSTHHQMMIPTEEAELLAWCDVPTFGVVNHKDDFLSKINIIPEVIFYEKTKCLCIQFHPEIMSHKTEAVKWVKEIAKRKLNIDLEFNSKSKYFGTI